LSLDPPGWKPESIANKRVWLIRGLLASLVLGLLASAFWPDPVAFPELAGPLTASTLEIPADVITPAAFSTGDENALALYLKDPDSSWEGLASGMKSMGIPFVVVDTIEAALQHDVIMVYPLVSGANSSATELQAMAAHVRDGGTLLAFSVLGGGLQPIFGFDSATECTNLERISFTRDAFSNAFMADLNEAEMGLTPEGAGQSYAGVCYQGSKHAPVASFDESNAAITHNFFETGSSMGHSYAIGLDLGHLILRAQGGRLGIPGYPYVNQYLPKIDIFLRFLAAVYVQGEPDAVLLSPTPGAKALTVLMTHDIDFTRSIRNIADYAAWELSAGLPATYFIQTKYLTDFNDEPFFLPDNLQYLAALKNKNMEIASHSVAHSNEFRLMDAGTGTEQYPGYRPFVRDFSHVENASVYGELRVSKFLLETLTGEQVVSFRPGHLSLPEQLPQALVNTGYRYSSSITANQAMTHLPYRDMANRSYEIATDIFEFPVTIEDERGRLGDRLVESISIAERIARYHGLVNVLIHTDILDHKLEFEKAFFAHFRDTAWFSTIRDYGNWWRARDGVSLAIADTADGGKLITLNSTAPIADLTLLLPENWHLQAGPAGTFQSGNRLSVGNFAVTATVEISVQ
jgi:hypothetical protein